MPRVSIAQAGEASAGQVQELVLTRTDSHAVTALRNGSGNIQVVAWNIAAGGGITRKGDATGGAATHVSATDWPEGPGVVTALRTAEGTVKVIAWKVSAAGVVTRAGDADGGAVSEVVISSPSGFAGVVTPVRTASGDLKVIAWKVSAAGVVTRAGEASAGACSKLAVSALASTGRFAIGLRNGSGNLEIITWSVSSGGNLTRLHDASAGGITGVALPALSSTSADLFSVTKGPAGDLTVVGWSLASDGSLKRLASAQGGKVAEVAAATWKPDVHSYAVAALRTDSGMLKLIVWRNGGDLDRNGELTGAAIKSVAMTTWKGGVLTAAADAAGNLKLNSWKLTPKGIRMLHRVWPAPTTSPAPPPPPPSASQPDIERGARIRVHSGQLDKPPYPRPGPPDPPDGPGTSAQWQHRYFPAITGVDPMLAVGHKFVIVTQDHRIMFMGRDGAVLASKAGESTDQSATTFFGGFLAANNPDGTPNPDNINTISPRQINEFYDTRVCYDAATKRFAILSAARKSGTTDTRFYAVAISKTEDPRDGFEQYMTTESNYRDFPRLTIHGDRVLVAHNAGGGGGGEGEKPVLSAFDLPSMRQGVLDPPNWQYFPNDVNGAPRVFLVSHNGDTGGMSFLFDIRSDKVLRIPAFPTAGQPEFAPSPVFVETTLPNPAPWPGPFGVFRNKTLHIAGSVEITPRVPNVAPARYSVRVIRVPMSTVSTSQVTVNAGGVMDHYFGLNAESDDPSDKVSYDTPGVAVNSQGDAIYAYGRTGVTTKNPLMPEVRYSVWLHGDSTQQRSRLLQAGSFQPTWLYDADPADSTPAETVATSVTQAYKLDYSTAVVDPLDDHDFWFIHEYADGTTNSWRTVIGVVDPTVN